MLPVWGGGAYTWRGLFLECYGILIEKSEPTNYIYILQYKMR